MSGSDNSGVKNGSSNCSSYDLQRDEVFDETYSKARAEYLGSSFMVGEQPRVSAKDRSVEHEAALEEFGNEVVVVPSAGGVERHELCQSRSILQNCIAVHGEMARAFRDRGVTYEVLAEKFASELSEGKLSVNDLKKIFDVLCTINGLKLAERAIVPMVEDELRTQRDGNKEILKVFYDEATPDEERRAYAGDATVIDEVLARAKLKSINPNKTGGIV